jgi:dynein heavy chain 1
MDKALEATAVQLATDEVHLALEVLKNAKRFHATMSFFSDTGLKEAQDTGETSVRNTPNMVVG